MELIASEIYLARRRHKSYGRDSQVSLIQSIVSLSLWYIQRYDGVLGYVWLLIGVYTVWALGKFSMEALVIICWEILNQLWLLLTL